MIRRAIAALPSSVDADVVAKAEAHLVAQAAVFGPKELGRLGRRILEVVAPEIADEAEARRLAEHEANALTMTRLTMRRLGDGTTRISGRLPDASATRFATYLEAHANPRQARRPRRRGDRGAGSVHPAALPPPDGPGVLRVPRVHRHQPGSRSTAVTPPRVVVTIRLAPCAGRARAPRTCIGAGLVPGDELTGDLITAAQARRLACTAKIIPAVLGGDSIPLDLGRARRLFCPGQRKALLLRDTTCRAEGCDVPGTWCRRPPPRPWSTGGRTDLANGLLLCSHHHHRAHDTGLRTDRLPNGDLRFHRRR